MAFIRLRRLRKNSLIRDIISQANVSAGDLAQPYFIIEGRNKREHINSMPGIYRLSVDNLVRDMKEARDLGIKAALLFGIPVKKDKYGKEAYNESGVIQKAIKTIRKEIGDIIIITDACLCGYASHGHCGIVKKSKIKMQKSKIQAKIQNFYIDNDKTLKILAKIALSHAEAGADFVAPSAMMDGQVKAIREALDKDGFQDTGILAYSAKYASNFYGPFREALDSTPEFGDRKTYQMDYRNSDEALREIQEDINEGADIIMVKPSLAYLDIIYRAKEKFNIPLAAYNVSGEYSAIKKLSQGDKIKEKDLALEVLTSIKRAGADIIITYHAKEAARWLK